MFVVCNDLTGVVGIEYFVNQRENCVESLSDIGVVFSVDLRISLRLHFGDLAIDFSEPLSVGVVVGMRLNDRFLF